MVYFVACMSVGLRYTLFNTIYDGINVCKVLGWLSCIGKLLLVILCLAAYIVFTYTQEIQALGIQMSHPKISNFGLCIENTN